VSTGVNARRQLARALQNDPAAVVSRSDARRVVNEALQELSNAPDTDAALHEARRTVEAARALLGDDARAERELERFEREVPTVLQGRGNQQALPAALGQRFLETFEQHDSIDPATVRLGESFARPDGSYSFQYRVDGGSRQTGYALPYDGDFVLSPVDLTPPQVHRLALAMRAHFDEHYVPNLQLHPGEVRAIVDRIVPELVLFPEYDAGYDPGGNHPGALVAQIANPYSDEGFFVTFDPAADRYTAYTS
jgi:hypothetical protein